MAAVETVALASDIYGEGHGPKLVIMHGLLGAARNWMATAKRLGADHEVHALDLRNHGRSPWVDGMSYEAMAADVAAYIGAHDLGAPTVLGHSMGGKAAMTLALNAPEIVGKLIVADIAPVAYARVGRSTFLDYVEHMAALDLGSIQRRADADTALADAIPDNGVRGFLLQNLVTDEAGGFRWRCNLGVLAADMENVLGFPEPPQGVRYDGPSLFLTGGASDYVKPEHKPLIRKLFPKTRFAALKDAGHWLHAEQPRPFMDAVRQFAAAG